MRKNWIPKINRFNDNRGGLFLGGSLALLLAGACSTTDYRAQELPGETNPEAAVESARSDYLDALLSQSDLLARESFDQGREAFEEAREGLEEKDEASSIVKDAARAKHHFNRSISTAEERKINADSILELRMAAVKAGAWGNSELTSKLKENDSQLIEATSNFKSKASPSDLDEIQKNYLQIETLATIDRELGNAKKIVSQAIEHNAKEAAPETLKTAQRDIATAENLIRTNTRQEEAYREAVRESQISALFLKDVMEKVGNHDGEITEGAAVELAKNDQRIQNQEHRIRSLQGVIDINDDVYRDFYSKYSTAQDKVEFQETIDNALEQFSPSEAEVFQQGDKLVVRLKKINFAVGEAKVPESSHSLLEKVGRVIRDVDPSEITVEGHTDSTGTPEINSKLSKERAQAVAERLQILGFSEDKIITKGQGSSSPLASNKTKNGRSLNRRVDIVVHAKKESSNTEL